MVIYKASDTKRFVRGCEDCRREQRQAQIAEKQQAAVALAQETGKAYVPPKSVSVAAPALQFFRCDPTGRVIGGQLDAEAVKNVAARDRREAAAAATQVVPGLSATAAVSTDRHAGASALRGTATPAATADTMSDDDDEVAADEVAAPELELSQQFPARPRPSQPAASAAAAAAPLAAGHAEEDPAYWTAFGSDDE